MDAPGSSLWTIENERPDFFEHASSGSTIADADAVTQERGRTFHGYKQGKYFFPNDGEEQDRLDFQHEIFRSLLDDQLGLAPVQNPAEVLDIATGTGIWALRFAKQHPKSHVVGTDLSLIQPSSQSSNCEFLREDAEDPWIFPYKLDYVHLRAVVSCFRDTKSVIQQAFDNLNEGGWIEFQDPLMDLAAYDDTYEGTGLQRWIEHYRQGFQVLGVDLDKPLHYAQWLLDAGFVDVVEKRLPLPCNTWPTAPKWRRIGQYNVQNMVQAITAFSAKTLPAAGLSEAEADEIIRQAVVDVQNPKIRSYCPVLIVYGRKPEQS